MSRRSKPDSVLFFRVLAALVIVVCLAMLRTYWVHGSVTAPPTATQAQFVLAANDDSVITTRYADGTLYFRFRCGIDYLYRAATADVEVVRSTLAHGYFYYETAAGVNLAAFEAVCN